MKILKRNFQGIFLWVKHGHPWHQGWSYLPSLRSGTLNVLQVPPWRNPLLDTLLMKILTQNFQGIFLGVKQGNPWHQRWSCHPSILSETINVLKVPPQWTPHSWHTSNEDINTKPSENIPWAHTRSSMTSRLTLSSKSPDIQHLSFVISP